jgi:cell division protein ZapA
MTDKADPPNLVHVDIFGQTYTVRAGTDVGYVEKLAAYVDSQMMEVSRAAGAVDSVRIAVLAALNIADECFQLRAQEGEAERRALAKAEVLARALGAALEE